MESEILFYLDLIENFDSKKPQREMPEDVFVVYSSEKNQQKHRETIDKPTCIVAYHGTDAVVWFRGTRVYAMKDLRLDLRLSDVNFLEGKCHSGFLEGTRRRLDDIMPYLIGKERITFIGHSLGGACAALAALILQFEKNITNVRALTLACPGIVSKSIAKRCSSFITSFVRKFDPIPIIFNYKKANKKWFKTDSAFCVPGRVFFLVRGKHKNVTIRSPETMDMKLTPMISFFAHCRRAYMKDIESVYGYCSKNRRSVSSRRRPSYHIW